MTLSISSSKQAREVGDRMLKEEKQVQDTRDITSGINPFLVQSSKQDQKRLSVFCTRAFSSTAWVLGFDITAVPPTGGSW